MSLQVRRVIAEDEFGALAPTWARLATEGGQTSPFLSHDWFACCWKTSGPGRSPEVLVAEDRGNPVAVVPLMRWRERVRGLPIRCLGFLDCPDTPFADAVIAGEARPVVDAILAHLETRSDWDVMHLRKLPSTSSTLKALEAALPGRFQWRETGTLSSPYLSISGDWDTFYAAKSQRFKKTCRNIQNRLERVGLLSVEEHCAVDPDGPVFRDVIDLTSRSWKADRGVAIATMPRMREFFGELTCRATAHGWLSLWLLKVNGRPLAMEYQLRADGKVHALRADYDLAHRDLSPGSALNFAIARALFKRGGMHEYDMGPGLNDYKLRWASGSHETVHLDLYRRSLYSRALAGLDGVVLPAARRLRRWLR